MGSRRAILTKATTVAPASIGSSSLVRWSYLALAICVCSLAVPSPARAQSPPETESAPSEEEGAESGVDPSGAPNEDDRAPRATEAPPSDAEPVSPEDEDDDDDEDEADDEERTSDPRMAADGAEEAGRPAVRSSRARPVRRELRETLPGMYPETIPRFKGKGVWLGSPDRRFIFRVTGFVQFDSRLVTDLAGERSDAYVLWRRTRVTLDGRFFGDFEYRVMWDNNTHPLFPSDFHLDWRKYYELNIRIGAFKSPLSLERISRSYALWHIERSYAAGLAPNRDVGLWLYGQTKNGFFNYDVAVLSGAYNLEILTRFIGTPEFANRVMFMPFRWFDMPSLKNFGIGFAWTLGQEFGSPEAPRLGRIRSSSTLYTLFAYRGGEDGAFAHGLRDRQSLHFTWFHNKTLLFGEWTRSAQRVARGLHGGSEPDVSDYLQHYAWTFSASYTFMDGDTNTFWGVKPSKPLNIRKGQFGAVTGSVRYTEIYFDRNAFPIYADPASAVQAARGAGTSWQWHLTPSLEAQADLEFNFPVGGAAGGQSLPTEVAFMTRIEARY